MLLHILWLGEYINCVSVRGGANIQYVLLYCILVMSKRRWGGGGGGGGALCFMGELFWKRNTWSKWGNTNILWKFFKQSHDLVCEASPAPGFSCRLRLSLFSVMQTTSVSFYNTVLTKVK